MAAAALEAPDGGDAILTRRLALLWKPALLLAGLLLAGFALRSGLGREALNTPAQAGPVVFVLIATVACALGLPRQVAAYAAGLGYGIWGGFVLTMIAMMLSCALDFVWARAIARNWAARRIRGRLARLDAAMSRNPFTVTLTLRLLPVGNNLALNLLAGVSAVAAWPFLAASALGYVPQTVVFVLLGSGVRVGHAAQVALAVGLFVVASLIGFYLLRRTRTGAAIG